MTTGNGRHYGITYFYVMLVVHLGDDKAPAKVRQKALHEVVPRKRLPAGPTLAQLVVIGHYY